MKTPILVVLIAALIVGVTALCTYTVNTVNYSLETQRAAAAAEKEAEAEAQTKAEQEREQEAWNNATSTIVLENNTRIDGATLWVQSYDGKYVDKACTANSGQQCTANLYTHKNLWIKAGTTQRQTELGQVVPFEDTTYSAQPIAGGGWFLRYESHP